MVRINMMLAWFVFLGALALAEDIRNWKNFSNSEYRFEIKYPSGWGVRFDEAKFPEGGNSSVPRFTVRNFNEKPDCYISIMFKTGDKPDKLTYSLSPEKERNRVCQELLDHIVSTFKFK